MVKHTLDAKNRILGRLAVEAAGLLRGKGKVDFVPYLDKGDEVVIKNTDKIKVSGKKMKDKIYYHHSGYPGGLRILKASHTVETKGFKELVKLAVYHMLPNNKLRREMMKHLIVEE